ncbi:MAG: DUF488 domain-containing protein [Candidatus Micrarchaeota archaeon]
MGEAVMRLYTIGYQGKTLEQLTQSLVDNKVEVLVDSRQLPWSHKKGFCKSNLKNAIEKAGIEYAHDSKWGAPKALRNELAQAWDYDEFFIGYSKHLDYLNGNLSDLSDLVREKKACLLCMEAKASECHRSILAERLKKDFSAGLEIVHL